MKRRGAADSLSGRNKGKEKGAIEIAENCISTVLMRRSRVQKCSGGI